MAGAAALVPGAWSSSVPRGLTASPGISTARSASGVSCFFSGGRSQAFTGVHFAFPEPFEWAFTYFDSDPSDRERPGEGILLTLISWHYGRFGGLSVRISMGPYSVCCRAVLFITGFIVWWRRVVVRSESSSRAN